MRTALTYPAIRMGGVETVTLQIAKELTRAGHDVTFVETGCAGEWSAYFRQLGRKVQTHRVRWWRPMTQHARRIGRVLAGYDLVILNDDAVGRAAVGLLPRGTTVLAILHTDLEGQYQTALGSGTDTVFVVTVSAATGKAAVRKWGQPPDRLVTVLSGVEVPEAWPRAEEHARAEFNVCFVGRLSDWHKGIFKLPDILMHLLRSSPQAKLHVVGDGPDGDALRSRFAQQRVTDSVRFHGRLEREGVRRVLADSDALVMPSEFEGFPIAPLEAMAMGVVPVVTRLKGSTDVMIEDGHTGFLIERGNVPGYASALTVLAADRPRLRLMSEACWKSVRKRFSAETMGRAYIDLIARERSRAETGTRSGKLDVSLLGDLPWLPHGLVRPCRKLLRMAGLWPPPAGTRSSPAGNR